jgi:hypothetical protein
MNETTSKKIQIKYSVKEHPIIDIPLTEFMSSVFRELKNFRNIIGDSVDIIRISNYPMIYHIILYNSNNPMHKIRFESFMKKVNNLSEVSKCLPDKLSVKDITNIPYSNENHPELRDGEMFITNSYENGREVGWKTKRIGKKHMIQVEII